MSNYLSGAAEFGRVAPVLRDTSFRNDAPPTIARACEEQVMLNQGNQLSCNHTRADQATLHTELKERVSIIRDKKARGLMWL